PRGGGPRPDSSPAGAGGDPRAAGGHAPVIPVARPRGGRGRRVSLGTGWLGLLTGRHDDSPKEVDHSDRPHPTPLTGLSMPPRASGHRPPPTHARGARAAPAAAADIQSSSRVANGPDNILFAADWKTARVHAIPLPDAPQKPAGTAFNILDLEALLSKHIGG